MTTVSSRSAARELFERLQRDDAWTIVEAWKADAEQETHHLEFKRKTSANAAVIDADDKDTIAKAVSGFANVGGGLLVIGVDAGGGNSKGQAFDRVRRLEPIADVEEFGAPLERTLRAFTDPPVAGLELAIVPTTTDATRGIVAILVPPSDGGPHRAVAASGQVNDRYYMRTAAGQQTMPHSLLAAMFARTAPPRLELQVRFTNPQRQSSDVELRLFNTGRGTARRPVVMLRNDSTVWSEYETPASPYMWTALRLENGKTLQTFEPKHDREFVLYPGAQVVVGRGKVRESFSDGAIRVAFSATLYAVDAQPVSGDCILKTEPGDDEHDIGQARAWVGREVE
jgi:hypothetical protein